MLYLLTGSYVRGLYLEGAGWNYESGGLERSEPKELIKELPILKVIPIESHRLKLQVKLVTVDWFLMRNHD